MLKRTILSDCRTQSTPLLCTLNLNQYLKNCVNDINNGERKSGAFILDHNQKLHLVDYSPDLLNTNLAALKASHIALQILPIETIEDEGVKGYSLSFYESKENERGRYYSQFADQEVYEADGQTFSILQRLVAPSFGGKQALEVLKAASNILGIPNIYVSDGSLVSTHKCCKESSLISLKLLQIFKYGKTWYEQRGATPVQHREEINYKIFKYLNKYVEKFFEANIYDEQYIQENYVEMIQAAQMEFNTSFNQSRDYLYTLKVCDLLQAFEKYKTHPVLRDIYNSTAQALELTQQSNHIRVGELVQKLVDLDDKMGNREIHQLRHLFLESVINFNYKYLLAFYTEKLLRPKSIKELALYMLLSLKFHEQFLGYFFDIVKPYYDETEDKGKLYDFFVKCFSLNDKDLKSYLQDTIREEAKHLADRGMKTWTQQEKDFMDEFYFENNYTENLQEVLSQLFFGPRDFDSVFFTLLLFNHLKNINISQLESWAPSFATKLNQLIGKKVFPPGSNDTLGMCLKRLESQPEFYKEVVTCLTQYLLQAAKFFPVHCFSEGQALDGSAEKFFLAKICAFTLGPFEFQFNGPKLDEN